MPYAFTDTPQESRNLVAAALGDPDVVGSPLRRCQGMAAGCPHSHIRRRTRCVGVYATDGLQACLVRMQILQHLVLLLPLAFLGGTM